jgi:CrcB protein
VKGARDLRRAARDRATLYAAVAVGSVIGGVLRALASLAFTALAGPALPWGTLFVNVSGSLAIGFYATLAGPDGRLFPGTRQRQFVMTGICGGYTTFSVFSLETLRLAQSGNLGAAGLNVALSMAGALAAVWLGHALATRLNRLKGS